MDYKNLKRIFVYFWVELILDFLLLLLLLSFETKKMLCYKLNFFWHISNIFSL